MNKRKKNMRAHIHTRTNVAFFIEFLSYVCLEKIYVCIIKKIDRRLTAKPANETKNGVCLHAYTIQLLSRKACLKHWNESKTAYERMWKVNCNCAYCQGPWVPVWIVHKQTVSVYKPSAYIVHPCLVFTTSNPLKYQKKQIYLAC